MNDVRNDTQSRNNIDKHLDLEAFHSCSKHHATALLNLGCLSCVQHLGRECFDHAAMPRNSVNHPMRHSFNNLRAIALLTYATRQSRDMI